LREWQETLTGSSAKFSSASHPNERTEPAAEAPCGTPLQAPDGIMVADVLESTEGLTGALSDSGVQETSQGSSPPAPHGIFILVERHRLNG